MLSIFGRSHRYCDGVSRRDFLRVGALGLGGLTLADLLRQGARSETAARSAPKSAIMIFMSGGPSHLDTYDLKPDLPAEFRGEFNRIQTNVPGMDLCELMPLQAKIADRLAVLRGVKTVGYHTGNEFFSGFAYEEGKADGISSRRPALGSIVSRLHGSNGIPAYVSLHDNATWEQPYYVGAAHRPFRVFKNQKGNQGLDNLRLSSAVSADQLQDRKALLRCFDTIRNDLDQSGTMTGLDAMNAQALEIITSNKVRDAFDLNKEPDRLRERYGVKPGAFNFVPGAEFLQARRLVEAGVRVVTVGVHGWDTHQDNFKQLRWLLPLIDQALHALITDLGERGMLDDVAIIMGGEMGRTPRITQERAGRDHWPQTGITLMAGGGLKTGQVVGASDARGEQVKGRAITPQMMLATLYHCLGIDPSTTLPDHNRRPMYLLDERDKIEELIA
jgi:Protein of unknown function (DUF1501)